MSRAVPVSTILSRIRWRADIEAMTARHTDAALLVELNRSIADLRERMSRAGSGLFISMSAGTTGVGATSPYSFRTLSLPVAAVEIYAFDLTVSATDIRSLGPLSMEQRNANGAPYLGLMTGTPVGFFPINLSTGTSPSFAMQVGLSPAPDRDYPYSVYYLAAWTDITGSDTIDCFDGFDDWLVLDVSLKVAQRDNDMQQAAALMGIERDKAWVDKIQPACRVQKVSPGRRVDMAAMRRQSRVDPFRRGL